MSTVEESPVEAPESPATGSEVVERPRFPYITKENARELQAKSIEARKRNARERSIATRADMQEKLLPHVASMIEDAVEKKDHKAFWRIFEQAFGRAPESVEVNHEGDVTIVIRSAFQEQGNGGA